MPEHIKDCDALTTGFVVELIGGWFPDQVIKKLTNKREGRQIVFEVTFQKREMVEVKVRLEGNKPKSASCIYFKEGKKKTVSAPYGGIQVDGDITGEI